MRLLQKTIRSYLIYSGCVLLIAVPVFYLAIKSIVREDTDEHLQATKVAIRARIILAIRQHDTVRLNFADPDITLIRSNDNHPFERFENRDIDDSVSGERVPYRILSSNFVVDGRPWLLQVRNSMLDSEDLIESIVKIEVLLLLLLLAGVVLINRKLSKKIWQPFYQTLDKLSRYRLGQQQPMELGASSVNEFDDLNRSLETLTGRAQQAYRAQKEFTENASHEIQTPLAILQSKLELLMQTSPLNGEQAGLISELADANQRLVRLNKSLILLTRIENRQFNETEPVAIEAVLQKTLDNLQGQIKTRSLAVETELLGDPIPQANRSLLEILVGNLLNNAIRHNSPAGLIRVALTDRQLLIQNTGKPNGLDPGKIFRRFYKESADVNSIGLGLQVVQQISNLYGWNAGYEFRGDLHSFSISFHP